jgi:hypothetical protein
MSCRIYIVPRIGSGVITDPYRPAYFGSQGLDMPWAAMDYGGAAVFIVGADTDDAQDATLTGQADVIGLPADLDTTIGTVARRNAVRAFLEARDIPGNWVQTATTYRTILRTVAGLFQFAQRLRGRTKRQLFRGGFTLATQWQNVPADVRADVLDAAQSFGYDTSGVTNTTTMRAILQALGNAWGAQAINLGCVTV